MAAILRAGDLPPRIVEVILDKNPDFRGVLPQAEQLTMQSIGTLARQVLEASLKQAQLRVFSAHHQAAKAEEEVMQPDSDWGTCLRYDRLSEAYQLALGEEWKIRQKIKALKS